MLCVLAGVGSPKPVMHLHLIFNAFALRISHRLTFVIVLLIY